MRSDTEVFLTAVQVRQVLKSVNLRVRVDKASDSFGTVNHSL